MGFISDLARKSQHFPGTDRGSNLWRETFGATNKEEQHKQPTKPQAWTRSFASDASVKRLVEAMRSQAPGGWTDDRYEQEKHFVGISYVAIHRSCEQLSQAEFQVFRKDHRHQDGKRPVPADHSLVRLLEKPNVEDSFGDLMYQTGQQMYLTGTGLTWMLPNQLHVPMELYPIPTAMAVPQAVLSPEYPNGFYRIQPLYPYGPFSSYPTPSTSVGAPIPAQWMLRTKFPHPLVRYDGYSPLTALRLHIDEVESIDRSRWYNMKRGINPSAVLNFEDENAQPLPEEEIDRIKTEFENEQMGPENQGRLLVASPGAKLEPWGAKPMEMEYSAGWDQLTSFVMSGLGITKQAAGMIEDSSYSTLFATLKQFHMLTLLPLCNRIASRWTRNLAPFFGDDLIIEIRPPRIDDHEVKRQNLGTLIQGKALTKNELRKALDMPMTQEKWGEEIAGTEAQPEGQEGGMPGMPGMGMPGMEGAGTDGGIGGQGGPPQASMEGEEPTDEDQMEEARPTPGNLGRGALGPRKHHSNGFHYRKKAKV